jgi:hypothetical protein
VQEAIRVTSGSTARTVGETAAAAVVAASGSAASEVASGHTLVVAWLSSAEAEVSRQAEHSKWQTELSEVAQGMNKELLSRVQAEEEARDDRAMDHVLDGNAALEASDGAAATQSLLKAIAALGASTGAKTGGAADRVKELATGVLRRMVAEVKASERAEAREQAVNKEVLWEQESDQAAKLIAELRDAGRKGEAYFDRETGRLQAQVEGLKVAHERMKTGQDSTTKESAAARYAAEEASQAVKDANRSRIKAETDRDALQARHAKLQAFADENAAARAVAGASSARGVGVL